MKFYEFGCIAKPVIVLIHGTGSHWLLSFGKVIEDLTDDFLVICVSLDGHDENEHIEMLSINDQTDKLEQYLLEKYAGKVCGIYGSSLGGSIVGKLLERGKLQIDIAVLGSTDFEQYPKAMAYIKARIVIPILYKYIKTGKLGLNKIFFNVDEIEMFKKLKKGMYQKISYETLFREYYTDLYTPIDNNMILKHGKVICVYGTKENGKTLCKRYKKHFPECTIIGLEGLGHEELLASQPEEWVRMVKRLCSNMQYDYSNRAKEL